MFDLLINGGTLVLPGRGTKRSEIAIRDGRIAALLEPGMLVESTLVLDASGQLIFPGLIDPHVHVGLTKCADEYGVETRAAAIGGVSTICCFLIQDGSYQDIYTKNLREASKRSLIDFTYHFIIMDDTHLDELELYVKEMGLGSHKFFMHFRGDEGAYIGVKGSDDGYLYSFLERLGGLPGGVAMIHAESIEVVWKIREEVQALGRVDLKAWSDSRPPFTEAEAISRVAYYAAETGCPIYIVHVSSRAGVETIRTVRNHFPKLKLYAETCPHYLTHSYDSPIGIKGKANPPLRSPEDVEALWEGIADGTIDTVGSDHVGRRSVRKQGDIWKASAGFPGLPVTLPVLLSEGHHKRDLPLERIAELTSLNPAKILIMDHLKGDLAVGLDADLTIVDRQLERKATAEYLGTWADYSIYEDWNLKGWPVKTLVRGRLVVSDGQTVAEHGWGRLVERTPPQPAP